MMVHVFHHVEDRKLHLYQYYSYFYDVYYVLTKKSIKYLIHSLFYYQALFILLKHYYSLIFTSIEFLEKDFHRVMKNKGILLRMNRFTFHV